jgi:hypothetical protein
VVSDRTKIYAHYDVHSGVSGPKHIQRDVQLYLLSLTDYRVVAVFLERRHGYALQHQRSTTFVVIAVKTSTKTDATEMVSMRLQAQPMQLRLSSVLSIPKHVECTLH